MDGGAAERATRDTAVGRERELDGSPGGGATERVTRDTAVDRERVTSSSSDVCKSRKTFSQHLSISLP